MMIFNNTRTSDKADGSEVLIRAVSVTALMKWVTMESISASSPTIGGVSWAYL